MPAVGTCSHEIRVAERAGGGCAVLLASRPQVAAGEPAEDGGATGIRALALQGVEDLLHGVAAPAHDAAPGSLVRRPPLTGAVGEYSAGSLRPASAKPRRRSLQASHRPHARPA